MTILALLGAVALGTVTWVVWHVRREVLRRRQVSRIRAVLVGRVSVAELRERCSADRLPRYPTGTAA